MPSDQIKAEITFVSKAELSAALPAQLAEFFAERSANIQVCAAKTAVAGMIHTLARGVFARDTDKTVFLYFKDDVHSLKIHMESQTPTSLDRLAQAVDNFQKEIVVEVARMQRFSKLFRYKFSAINAVVSLNYAEISTGQQKLFGQRLSEGLKTTSLIAKASGVIASGVASYLFHTDPAAAGQALLAGLFAIVVAALAEAALGDAFKFQRR